MTSRSQSDVKLMLSTSYGGNSVKDGVNTEFDSTVPEAYSTIETAKKEHSRYNSHQVKDPEGSNSDQPGGPPSEYDVIPTTEGSVTGGTVVVSEEGGSGGVATPTGSLPRRRLEAKNVLYEDNELPGHGVQHRGVHAASYTVFTRGGVSEGKKGSYITCRCKTRTLIVTFFVALALLLAVASLVLSVLLWFGVYDPSPSSSSSLSSTSSPPPTTPPTVTGDCPCPEKAEMEELRSTLNGVKQQLEAFKNDVSRNVALREALSAHLSLVQTNLSDLQSRYREAEEGGWPAVLSGVTGLEGCLINDVEHSCTIPNDILDGNVENSCVTPDQYVEIEGQFLVSAECITGGDEPFPPSARVAAALELLEVGGVMKMRCRCSPILDQPAPSGGVTISEGFHYCALREIRCPVLTGHNATLSWQK